MVGKTSLSGAQKKISVNISADRQTLQVATGRGFYILKPPTETYPHIYSRHFCALQAFRNYTLDALLKCTLRTKVDRYDCGLLQGMLEK